MVNSKDLKAGSLIEAQFNDGPNRSGIVTELIHQKGARTEGELFGLRALFYMEEFKAHWNISIESSQVVFVAPTQPDLPTLLDEAKQAVMRWTCTIDGEESVQLDFTSMTMPEDGFNLSKEEADKLKSMQVGDSFVAGDEGQALIKRVA